jgi:predicted DNA-binding transcriptional regulator AlpA
MSYQLLDTKMIADMLAYGNRTVRDKLVKRKDFPKPLYLPCGEAGCSRKRWKKSEVIEWLERINPPQNRETHD